MDRGRLHEPSRLRTAVTPRNRRSAITRSARKVASKEQTVSHIWDNFLENTQITWVYYGSTRRGIWRIVWVVVILSGITIALFQSRKALEGYSGFAVSLETTYRLNATLPFPAVTICSNSVIDWTQESSSNTSVYHEITLRLQDENERTKYNNKFKKKGKPYEEYILLDVLRKYPLPKPTYGVVKSIYWNGTKYTANSTIGNFRHLEERQIIKTSRTLYYGDCLTFNAGVDSEETVEASALTSIQFTMEWDPKDRYPDIGDPAIVMMVHPVGTAPTLGDGSSFKIYPKDEVTVGIREREIVRLPSPYPSQCVDNDRYPLRANSVYYSDNRRYLYSVDACINTCVQKLSLDICSCWDYQIPVGLLHNHSKFETSTICASRCSKIDQELNMALCKCNLPCSEISLGVTYVVKSNLVTDIITNDLNQERNNSLSQATPANVQLPAQKTTLKVFLKTSVYEYSDEVPKYTVSNFWGIVGGNVAGWIGVSVVSFFEFVELAIILAYHAIYKKVFGYSTILHGNSEESKETKTKKRKKKKKRKEISEPNIRLPDAYGGPHWERNRFNYMFDPVLPLYADNQLVSISITPYYEQNENMRQYYGNYIKC